MTHAQEIAVDDLEGRYTGSEFQRVRTHDDGRVEYEVTDLHASSVITIDIEGKVVVLDD